MKDRKINQNEQDKDKVKLEKIMRIQRIRRYLKKKNQYEWGNKQYIRNINSQDNRNNEEIKVKKPRSKKEQNLRLYAINENWQKKIKLFNIKTSENKNNLEENNLKNKPSLSKN